MQDLQAMSSKFQRRVSDPKHDIGRIIALSLAFGCAWMMGTAASAHSALRIEEATIGDIQRAIR